MGEEVEENEDEEVEKDKDMEDIIETPLSVICFRIPSPNRGGGGGGYSCDLYVCRCGCAGALMLLELRLFARVGALPLRAASEGDWSVPTSLVPYPSSRTCL